MRIRTRLRVRVRVFVKVRLDLGGSGPEVSTVAHADWPSVQIVKHRSDRALTCRERPAGPILIRVTVRVRIVLV